MLPPLIRCPSDRIYLVRSQQSMTFFAVPALPAPRPRVEQGERTGDHVLRDVTFDELV
jgi:hypothetical protein